MSIAEKLSVIAENQEKIFDAGKKSEYDSFWGSYQYEGKGAVWYNYAFAGKRWNEKTFRPKYDLIASGCAYMFSDSSIKNLKQLISQRGLRLDTSKATSVVYMFSNSLTSEIGVLDMTSATVLTGLFYGAKVEKIEKLILKNDGSNTFSNAFNTANNLYDITFEGTIGKSLDMHWSTKLGKESIENLFSHLSGEKGATLTLSLDAVDSAFQSEDGACDGSDTAEWQALVEAHAGWTVSLL